MAAPPARTEISDVYPNPSNAVARTGIGKLFDYVTGLLGATGNSADARVALGLGVIGQRNRAINGNFQINQRNVSGTVVLTAGQYGHDRWKGGASGCTYTFSATGLDTTITISAGSLQQVIESVNVEGGNYVLTWTGTAQGKIGGGVYGASGIVSGGVAADTSVSIEFGVGTVTRVQFEVGLTPTPYDRRPLSAELAMCQRYYEVGTGRLAGYNGAGGLSEYGVNFKVTKRAAPTLGYASTTNTNVNPFDARNPSVNGLTWYCVVTAAGGFVWEGTWTATAEL